MFNDLLVDSSNIILVARLNRILPELTSAGYSTLEDYQAAIYSAVNKILALQNSMQPLMNIKGETPAEIGDFTTNVNTLNNDAIDTVSQLASVENDTANLFNLGEASQTSIRQTLREQIFANNTFVYQENFINNLNIQTSTTTIDYQAGIAVLPLSSEIFPSFAISVGTSSVGLSTSPISNLDDGAIDTTYVWNGTVLELILSFSSPQIINRLIIDLDTYDGLDITKFTSSPDGTIYNDILSSLNVSSIPMDASSGKFSGSVIIDFPPQYATNVQIVINNVIGENTIALRNISLSTRLYAPSGQLTSTLISNPIGSVNFTTNQLTSELTNIIHQVSYDNVHFNIINTGIINISQPFWYRVLLSRSNNPTGSTGLTPDPANSTYYTLISSTTLSLGSNITERTIVLSAITGPIVLSETPLQTSLKVQVSSTFLNPSQYTFINNTITLGSNQSNLTIIYQTSGLNAQTLSTLQNYYTPILQEVKFEV